MSSRRVGVPGLEVEGELKVNSRLRDGVVGSTEFDVLGRVGEAGLASGGVTSVCKMDVNIVFACSVGRQSQQGRKNKLNFRKKSRFVHRDIMGICQSAIARKLSRRSDGAV